MDLKYQNINQQVQVSGQNIVPYLLSIAEYMQNSGITIIPYPKVVISPSPEYAMDPFGKTDYYDPSDEGSILWSDPDLDIPWPIANPVLSTKDESAKRLVDLRL